MFNRQYRLAHGASSIIKRFSFQNMRPLSDIRVQHTLVALAAVSLFMLTPGIAASESPQAGPSNALSALSRLMAMLPLPILKGQGVAVSKNIDYTELLDTIAKGESKGNYNAYYGNVANTSTNFTAMTVTEVMQWQNKYVAEGSPSSAVGKYQFMQSTLEGLVEEHGIDKNAKFDETLQDKLAVALLERRGLKDYIDNKISREEFAHHLSKEWAALPRAIGEDPDASYYAGDGLNEVKISIAEINTGIDSLHQ